MTLRAQIYVSPTGNDANPGTFDFPYKTLAKAISVAGPDSLIYMRGGTYAKASNETISKSGLPGKYIKVWAYPGETPVLDFSQETGSSDGLRLSGSYLHIKGIEEQGAAHNGIYITGNYNIVEHCAIHSNRNTGLHMRYGAGNNFILNCDAFLNYDPPIGGNADGFSAKWEVGPGNVFKGCRAYNNSDDGWDLWMGQNTVEIDSCFAFRNGLNIWGDSSVNGNGNGFKLGGSNVPAPHVVRNCVAFDNAGNTGRGFDENNNLAGQTLYNCTAYRNQGDNYHFTNTVTQGQHIIKNCISYVGVVNITSGVRQANSWQGFTVTASDFLSLDTSWATAPRNPDGTLPEGTLLHLAPGSSMIDAGVDVGLPYNGSAPDLGAFETTPALFPPAAPQPVFPADGSDGVQPTLVIGWNRSQSAERYAVQVALDSSFAALVLDDTTVTDTAKMVGPLAHAIRYFWRVRGRNGAGWGLFSASWTFTTIVDAPPAPQLAAPSNGSTGCEVTLKLVWMTRPEAESYRLQLSADSGFTVPVLEDSTLSDTNRTVIGLQGASAYYWRVRGKNIGGLGPWSDAWRFETMSSTSTVCAVSEGWNLLSIPLTVSDPRKSMLFPTAEGDAYSFDPLSGYIRKDTLLNGVGYWLKFSIAEQISIAGSLRTRDTIGVASGWNLIGSISSPIPTGAIQQIPPGIIESSFFRFDGGYAVEDTLQPAKGYWAKAAAAGILVLSPPPGSPPRRIGK